ncbi:cytidylate kinase [Candidatus Thorarchaeota archaeon]|nr:MAG: cytidylate kinase [Candidatus Thorarchaeota archaeon]
MKRVVTIGGLHGTGKSSVADHIAERFELRRVSAGTIFRELAKERGLSLEEFSKVAEEDVEIDQLIDNRLRTEAEKGDIITDGQLAGWMAGENSDLNVYLMASDETRVKRIAERDSRDFDEALEETIAREASERERYLEYYGVDILDLSIYDLVINTDLFSLDEVVEIVAAAVEGILF